MLVYTYTFLLLNPQGFFACVVKICDQKLFIYFRFQENNFSFTLVILSGQGFQRI